MASPAEEGPVGTRSYPHTGARGQRPQTVLHGGRVESSWPVLSAAQWSGAAPGVASLQEGEAQAQSLWLGWE